jgi:hypothetical protein
MVLRCTGVKYGAQLDHFLGMGVSLSTKWDLADVLHSITHPQSLKLLQQRVPCSARGTEACNNNVERQWQCRPQLNQGWTVILAVIVIAWNLLCAMHSGRCIENVAYP